jgi:hypothetical protein
VIRKIICLIFFISFVASATVPVECESRGISGGGSLYSLSINQANDNECYVVCDMSELYHSIDFGTNFKIAPLCQMQGGRNASVQFTSDPKIRYCVSYANDIVVPVKSIDGGTTWAKMPGN